MQHVLRCWERQSYGKKTLRRPGLRPGPAEGAYSAPANPLVGGEGLVVPSPRTDPPTHPRFRPFGPRLSYPHSKISSDAIENLVLFTSLTHTTLSPTYVQGVKNPNPRSIPLAGLTNSPKTLMKPLPRMYPCTLLALHWSAIR